MAKKKKIMKWLLTLLVGGLALTMVMPLIWMIISSFKQEIDVFAFPVEWIPKHWNIKENYSAVLFGDYNFGTYYKNSIIYSVTSVSIYLVICSMAAYAFAKIEFPHKDKLFLLILATMMIPQQLLVIPQFMILQKLHLGDTITGLVLRGIFSSYGVFLLRQFMVTIPDSILESAKIDGAGHMNIFAKIIMPMTKPAVATLTILKFVWTWNDYQGPLIFLRSKEKFTLQIGITQFVSSDGQGQIYSLVMTAAVLAIVPLFFVFVLFQKQVVGGLSAGAVKG